MAEGTMMTFAASHAILLSDDEADAILSGTDQVIRREFGTRLRMPVAFARQSDRTLFGVASLAEVEPADDEAGGFAWMFANPVLFDHALSAVLGAGPIWSRLPGNDRKRIAGVLAGHGRDSASVDRTEPECADLHVDLMTELEHAWTYKDPAEAQANQTKLAATAQADLSDAGQSPPATSSPIEAAHARAMKFVPSQTVDLDTGWAILIRLRDEEIKPSFPDVLPQQGILRKSMLQAFLDEGVASIQDYESLIPVEMRNGTNQRHVSAYLDAIIGILARIE